MRLAPLALALTLALLPGCGIGADDAPRPAPAELDPTRVPRDERTPEPAATPAGPNASARLACARFADLTDTAERTGLSPEQLVERAQEVADTAGRGNVPEVAAAASEFSRAVVGQQWTTAEVAAGQLDDACRPIE